MELKRLQALIEQKVVKPEICLTLEKHFDKKFKGPFSDGREWDVDVKFKSALEAMEAIGNLAKLFSKMTPAIKSDYNLRANMGLKIDKNTSVSIDINDNVLTVTVFSDKE